MNACQEFAALLDPYVDGELPAEEAARVRAHLDTCGGCRSYVDTVLAIRAAFPSVEDTVVPDGFADGVMAVIHAGNAPRAEAAAVTKAARKRPRSAPWAKLLLPLAACCALVILVQQVPWRSPPTEAGSGVNAAEAVDEPAVSADRDPSLFRAAPAGGEAETENAAPADAPPAPQTSASGGDAGTAPGTGAAITGDADTTAPTGPTVFTAKAQTPKSAADGGETGGSPAPVDGGEDTAPESSVVSEDMQTPADTPPQVMGSRADGSELPSGENGLQSADAWVEHGNVVFASTVYLTSEEAGDALEGFEGKPYSNADFPEKGVIGTGYALEQADFERILTELSYEPGPVLNQERTTELNCIVVTDADSAAG